MATKEAEVMEQRRLRRQRINRIKTGIVMSIAIWMLVSFLAIIILSIQVIKLNSQMSDVLGSAKKGSEHVSDDAQEKRFDDIVTGIDTDDNFAKEGDTHYVYLTFNSVPGDNTEDILDVLSRHNVKATFFVTGSETEGAKEVYRRIVEEGHTIGMHSYSNQYSLIYSSKDAFKEDYQKLSDYIYELTGTRSQYYRFLGGSGNAISNVNMAEFVDILNQEKITYFDWNVSAGDAANKYTTKEIIDNVLGGISKYKTSVVLMHDDKNKSTTVEALSTMIEELENQGAVILPIDENTDAIQYIKAESVK